METTVFPAHKGAKSAMTITGVLVCLLIITLPIGIWLIIRGRAGRVVLDDSGLHVRMLFSVRVRWDEISRIGLLINPVPGLGIGNILARKKVGGAEAVNLCLKTKAGRTRHFIVSMYENWQEIVSHVEDHIGNECETLSQGLGGPKWPGA